MLAGQLLRCVCSRLMLNVIECDIILAYYCFRKHLELLDIDEQETALSNRCANANSTKTQVEAKEIIRINACDLHEVIGFKS